VFFFSFLSSFGAVGFLFVCLLCVAWPPFSLSRGGSPCANWLYASQTKLFEATRWIPGLVFFSLLSSLEKSGKTFDPSLIDFATHGVVREEGVPPSDFFPCAI